VSWAAGTIYVKWARIKGDAVAVTAWQMLTSFLVITACSAALEGVPQVWPLRTETVIAIAFQGLIASGLAYLIWFDIVGRLPVATASLGSLCVPVVGILGSMVILGERPTLADALGFTLIFAAAACVLLQPAMRTTAYTSPQRSG